MHPALLVQDLSVSAHGRRLVDGVSFSVHHGERLAFLGASGSGKSLTAAALLGQLPAGMTVSGLLQVNGKDVALTGKGSRIRYCRDFAAVHQNPMAALNPLVNLGRQLGIPLRNAGLSPKEAHERALALLASVGIEGPERILASFSGELSGGQLQRVCIALALACRSRILVADEPTTALDMVNQAKVLNVLSGTAAPDSSMLFITHDLAAAEVLCSRAIVLQAGRIVEEASMSALLDRPAHPFTAQLVDAARTGLIPYAAVQDTTGQAA